MLLFYVCTAASEFLHGENCFIERKKKKDYKAKMLLIISDQSSIITDKISETWQKLDWLS